MTCSGPSTGYRSGGVDREIGHVKIAGGGRQDDGHEPRIPCHATHAPDVAHIEEPSEVAAEGVGTRFHTVSRVTGRG